MPGDMDRAAARGGEKFAERRLGDTEGDRSELRGADRIGKGAAEVAGADRLDKGELHAGEGDTRLGVGGTERRQRGDVLDDAALRPCRRQRRIDYQLGNEPLLHEAVTEALDEEVAQCVEPVFGDGEAG